MKFITITALLLLALIMVFAVQNAAMVPIQFLFWQFEFPRSLLLFLTLLIGIVIGWVIAAWTRRPHH